VFLKNSVSAEGLVTDIALVTPFWVVSGSVRTHVTSVGESPVANIADVRLFTGVSSDVAFEEPLPSESLVAIRAHAVERNLRASADVILVLGQAGSDKFAGRAGKRLSSARGSRRRRG